MWRRSWRSNSWKTASLRPSNSVGRTAKRSHSSILKAGAAYLVSKAIRKARVLAFADLGMEAIYEFEVEDMPVTVAVDARGTSVHETGPAEWQRRIREFKIPLAVA